MIGRCDYCGAVGPVHREHMIPRALGGTDEPGNIAVACPTCNSRKGTKIGRWLPCGRASWLGYCLDGGCVECAPARIEKRAKDRRLKLVGIMVRRSKRHRDAAIRDAVAAGGSLREVGEAAGLSHTAVKFIAHGRPSG